VTAETTHAPTTGVCPVAHGYDPLAAGTVADPYPALNELREASPRRMPRPR
jgi:hypothetical protein